MSFFLLASLALHILCRIFYLLFRVFKQAFCSINVTVFIFPSLYASFSFAMFLLACLSDWTFLGAAEQWQMGFQSPVTSLMVGIIDFHNQMMQYIVGVGGFVMWILWRCLNLYDSKTNKNSVDNFTHATALEIIWTIVPAIILAIIAVPSFALLYSMDEMLDPQITLKIVGHQWYWSYEFSDYNWLLLQNEKELDICFDSYMIHEDMLHNQSCHLRLLEVDNRVVLPSKTHIRLLVTAADVLHSWAVPSFGVKVDACPGRLNQSNIFVYFNSVLYGQCSELCGANHGFMPICVEIVSTDDYIKWLEKKMDCTFPSDLN